MLRTKAGWTQNELAQRSGTLTRLDVVNVEGGRNQATSGRILGGLATAFGVSVEAMQRHLLDGASLTEAPVVRSIELDPRYPSRSEAIAQLLNDPEWHGVTSEEVEEAADAFAVALDADEDPGFGFWFDGIRQQLKLRRRGKMRLGVRELEE